MLIFIFIVSAYCSANVYLFFKLSSLFGVGPELDIFIGLFILFMTSTPVLIPILSHSRSEKTLRFLSYTGYLWLATIVIFSPLGVLFDLYNYLVPRIPFEWQLAQVQPLHALLVPLCMSIILNIYGLFEARHIRIERLTFRTSKLPEHKQKIRLVQISDLHLGIIVRDRTLARVIKLTNRERPDIFLSTGDLIDGTTRHIRHLAAEFKKVNAPSGKFAVMGNHEVYGGAKHAVKFIEKSGFTLLRGRGVTVSDAINIAGMDFLGGEAQSYAKQSDQKPEHEILNALPGSLFTLLLKHKSDVEKESLGLFDLQLSGHTHGGQIFPMNLATMFIFSYHSGFTKLAKGSAIYTSRGTGTSGPPIRFLSSPEITVIDIIREQS